MSGSNAYAHGHSDLTIKAHAQRNVETCAKFVIPYLANGTSVLDLGCGPGSITADFAKRVGPRGRAVGIDRSQSVVDVAKQTWHDSNVEFVVGDITSLPFEDDSFDIVYAHQVFVHLSAETQERAFAEARRVCKPGGIVALREAQLDNDTLMYPIDPLLIGLVKVILQRAVSSGAYAQAASHLPAMAERVGFSAADIERNVTLETHGTPEARTTYADIWAGRSGEESLVKYALEHELMTWEELESLPDRWRRWRDTPHAWLSIVQLEMIFRK